jgi:Lon protease-like protein
MNFHLDLFPLSTVLVPGGSLRLHIFEDRYKTMIGTCLERGTPIGVVLDLADKEVGDGLDPATVGTTAEIREATHLSEGRLYIVTRGVRRFRVDRFVQTKPFWSAEVSYLEEPLGPLDAAVRLRAAALERFRDYLQALLQLSGRELEVVQLPDDPNASSFLIADAMQVDAAAKQSLLESPSAAERLIAELKLLDDETRRLRAARSNENDEDDAAQQRKTFTVRISLN